MAIFDSTGILSLGELGEEVASPPAATAPSVIVQMFLNSVWTDVTGDVRINAPIHFFRGMRGSSPFDRMASTGFLSVNLDNSQSNSAGLLGYYSPDHANKRSGFALGTRMRIKMTYTGTDYYKFHGRIADISVAPGKFLERYTNVIATDYMDMLATNNLAQFSLMTGTRADLVITSIVNAMPIAPLTTSYATSPDTLSYALVNDLDEKTSFYAAIKKAVQSDFGYCYVIGNTTNGETLVYAHRNSRDAADTSPSVTIDDTMNGLSLKHSQADIFTEVRAVTYPVRVDAAATTVLATAREELVVPASSSITIILRYVDPTGGGRRVSGTAMVTPVSVTDYKFSATAGGSGSDLNASISIVMTFGANSAKAVITNSAGVTAYGNLFQLRGKGIYAYEPIESRAASPDNPDMATHSRRSLVFSLPYQQSTTKGQTFATELLDVYDTARTIVSSVRFTANTNTDLLVAAHTLDIGDHIFVQETVSGISTDYFITSVEMWLYPPNIIVCEWGLEPSLNGWS